jgi:hypothetical protein
MDVPILFWSADAHTKIYRAIKEDRGQGFRTEYSCPQRERGTPKDIVTLLPLHLGAIKGDKISCIFRFQTKICL